MAFRVSTAIGRSTTTADRVPDATRWNTLTADRISETTEYNTLSAVKVLATTAEILSRPKEYFFGQTSINP